MAYASMERPYARSEFLLAEKPEVTSIVQRKEERRIDQRRALGLTDKIHLPKEDVPNPSLSYITEPKHVSKTHLQTYRRGEMLNELKKTEGNIGKYKDGHTRMLDREDCALRKIANGPQSKMTRKSLD